MWRFAAARATGVSHLKTGLECQDRFACALLAPETLVVAVADGAGSATLSELGARTAVEAVVRAVRARFEAGRRDFAAALREAAVEAREGVLAAAADVGAEVRELASTLLAVVASPAGGAALQIGDGVIVVSDGGAEWSWVFWPQRGEYANTTCFLTDEDALSRLQVEPLAGLVTDVALTTDGLEPLALHYASQTVHEPFFHGLFAPLIRSPAAGELSALSAALEAFLSSERVAERTTDDVAIVLATRRAAAEAAEAEAEAEA
jgi:hypothetical protein